jgi:hypothetical protein
VQVEVEVAVVVVVGEAAAVAGAVFGLAGTYGLASRHVPQLRSQLSALGWKEQKVRLATRSDARRTEGDAGGGHEAREETAGDRSRSRSR